MKEGFEDPKKFAAFEKTYFYIIDAHVAQPTWAGRVRNGIKNSFEYNKDTEVSCKLINGKDRSDIYKLLQEISFNHTNFE